MLQRAQALLRRVRGNAVEELDVDNMTDLNMHEWHIKNRLTPDMFKLEQFHRQLIFIPDNMKQGGDLHYLIQKHSFDPDHPVNPVCFTEPKFTMWKKDLGEESYPIILPADYRPSGFVRYPVEPARICGELWAIRPKAFIDLDIAKQNGMIFTRQRVRIMYPYREIRYGTNPLPWIGPHCFTTEPAWMYLGIKKYWDPQIGGIFASCQMDVTEPEGVKPWLGNYYEFPIEDN